MKKLTVLLLAAGLAAPAAAEAPNDSVPSGRDDFGRGTANASRSDRDSALDEYEAALRADPDHLHRGTEYRQAAIAAGECDRAFAFLEALVEAHPEAPNLRMNFGYAHVDKMPAAGAISRVALAERALTQISAALEIGESWLRLYTRGNGYLYWPPIFDRAELGIADLEKAIELSGKSEPKPYHAYAWAALGDGHWRLGDSDKAREVWNQGLELYPGDPRIEARLSRRGRTLDAYLEQSFSAEARVETHLRQLLQ